jgi:hypothetical protein
VFYNVLTMKITSPNTALTIYAALIILFSFLALSCKDNTIVDPGTSVGDLKILSAYPPDGGVGPFDTYTPNPDSVKAHFFIHFSRTMNLTGFTPKSVKCEGFDIPVAVKILYHYPYQGEVVGFSIVRNVVGQTSAPLMTYGINKTYTITIDSTVEDFTGAQLREKFVFSFTPEPYFRVVNYSYSNGDTVNPANVEIFFNSKLSSASLAGLSISPFLSNSWSVNSSNDSCTALCDVYGNEIPSTSYMVAVGQGISDLYGNIVHEGASKSFITPPFIVASNQFPDGINNVNLSTLLVLKFNYPMDTASIRAAFTFTPATPMELSIGQNQLSCYVADDFVPNTDYELRLSTGLKTVSGYQPSSPTVISFHTAAFGMTHTPSNGERGLSTHSIIQLKFTGAINTSTVESAVTITPAFDHYTTFDVESPGKYIYTWFAPKDPLPGGVTFKVKIANTIKSIAGYTLAQPDSFSFTTGYSKK